jgi:hypothetical protein
VTRARPVTCALRRADALGAQLTGLFALLTALAHAGGRREEFFGFFGRERERVATPLRLRCTCDSGAGWASPFSSRSRCGTALLQTDRDTLDLLSDNGADPELLALLEKAIGDDDSIDIAWE